MALSGDQSLSMQISARWVFPVTSTRILRKRRSTIQGADVRRVGRRHPAQCHFHLVEAVVAGFVDTRRLAGRADVLAREQHREGRMALPVEDDALQQIRATYEGRVVGGVAAEHDMVAAAGPDMPPIEHIFVGAEPHLPRILVKAPGYGDRLIPIGCRMDIDLDHAGIGRDFDDVEPRVEGRAVTLDMDLQPEIRRGAPPRPPALRDSPPGD